MPLRKLDLKSLADMDGGRIGESASQALARLTDDMVDRPGNDAVRTLTLVIKLKPIPGEGGTLDGVNTSVKISEAIPPRKSKPYAMRPAGKGGLVFNDATPEHPDQGTLWGAESEAESDTETE